jgi:CUB/sushi domain-containing protein
MNIYTSILILILVLHKGLATYTAYSGKYWKKLLHSTYYNNCPSLTHPYHGKVKMTHYGRLAAYSCSHGYTLVGSKIRKCYNSKWTGTTPKCEIDICKDVDCDDYCHQQKQTYKRLYYSCNVGFILTGKPTTKPTILHQHGCTTDTLICEAVHCDLVVPPENGVIHYTNGITYSSIAVISCNEGYHLTGSGNRSCEADGSWSGTQPFCKEINGQYHHYPKKIMDY